MSKSKDLTEKQYIFCMEYLTDFNATRAALKAGYSKKSADSQASRMLKNVKVKAYLDKKQEKRAEKLDITADRILQELSHIAFFDIRNIFDANSLKQINDIDENTARAISSVKSRLEKLDGEKFAEVVEVKSNDKLRALDMLAKHLGMYETDSKDSKDEEKNNSSEITFKRIEKE